ncbi:MAG: precorrin-6y C5,15-methyltransferase (decarboxylating) subunit CbiE [Chloroflexaceae bacterium]
MQVPFQNAPSSILVVGMNSSDPQSLPVALRERIMAADLLAGGRRHLRGFPDFAGTTFPITSAIDALIERLQQALVAGERVVVLASGDPLFYGIGSSLCRALPAEALEIIPAPTACQMAFAALAEPWHDAALLSAHARPLEEVIAGVRQAGKAAILTDNRQTPAVIAQALLAAGMPPTTACAVCANLGQSDQQIIRTNLEQAAGASFAPLNVFVVWSGGTSVGEHVARSHPPGLPDAAFATSAGLITKREVRLLSLAELALGPGEVLWDIGAGSGAVGIEAARAQPTAQVYAVEQRPALCKHIRENLRRFPAPNLHLVEGSAPAACTAWPRPHAVFIGGSGGRLAAIIELAQQRLYPGGRLVINLVTLENLQTARTLLPAARVVQMQVNVGMPIGEMLRFEGQNPVFVVTMSV